VAGEAPHPYLDHRVIFWGYEISHHRGTESAERFVVGTGTLAILCALRVSAVKTLAHSIARQHLRLLITLRRTPARRALKPPPTHAAVPSRNLLRRALRKPPQRSDPRRLKRRPTR
jgi:hypothetical protein